MSRRTTYLLILAALTIGFVTQSAAAAQPYLNHGGCGYGCYHSLYTREYIPYFAQHPPVYYSYPVPRTYGWSPYAYPPGVMTPEIEELPSIEPAMIQNPYVEPTPESEATDGRMAGVKPLVIENAFYVADTESPLATDEVATASRPARSQ